MQSKKFWKMCSCSRQIKNSYDSQILRYTRISYFNIFWPHGQLLMFYNKCPEKVSDKFTGYG